MSERGNRQLNDEHPGELWTTPQRALMERHRWNGGYCCACGAEMNSPQTWSAHVLEEAWQHFTKIGAESARIATSLRVDKAITETSDQADWVTIIAIKAALRDETPVGD